MKRFAVLFLMLTLLLSGCGTVMKADGYKLSNTEFSYYYWSEYFYFAEVYGQYQENLDTTKPLDEQMYDDTTTWQDYMVEQTITAVEETMALVFAAEEAGFQLPQDYQDAYDDVMVNFIDAAMAQGYKNVDAYLQASYGKGADRESFEAYLFNTHLASAYADKLYEDSVPTEEEAQDYFQENASLYEEGGLDAAMQDLHSERYNNAFREATADCSFTIDRDNIRITAPQGLYK